MSMLSLNQLAVLGRHRWTIPVIAAVAERQGARSVELLHALPISRESLARALVQAADGGWIMRNLGHGHPLRPEYVLTEKGTSVAEAVCMLERAKAALGLTPGRLGRWCLPVLRQIGEGETRFNALERTLGVASPRALTLTLKALAHEELVVRHVVDDWPPVTRYALTQRGRTLNA